MTSTHPQQATADRCPACGGPGKGVKSVTIASLVRGEALAGIGEPEGFRFCAAPACDVAYFRPENDLRILRSDVRVRIGQKEAGAPRPVCYCFGHTVEEIEAEVARTGASTVADDITQKCREGLARCEETNPQGSCCLGNVRNAIRGALARRPDPAAPERPADKPTHECCGSPVPPVAAAGPRPPRAARAGLWASAGAVLSAVFSSACCWLPLLLVAFGASAAGVAGFFETYRPWFLGATALLLGGGFYFVYFSKPACAPGDACAAPSVRLARFNRTMLWMATAFTLAFALFPTYVGSLLGAGGPAAGAHESVSDAARTFRIEGMTCEACSAILREHLSRVPGVARADVSFAEKTARVAFEKAGAPPTDAALDQAIRAAGYRGAPVEDGSAAAGKGR